MQKDPRKTATSKTKFPRNMFRQEETDDTNMLFSQGRVLDFPAFESRAFEDSTVKKKPSTWSSVMIFSNTVLGSGIIALPFAIKLAGVIPGLFFVAFLALLVDWTVNLLAKCAKTLNAKTYEDLSFRSGGPHLRNAVSLAQLAFSFGGMCTYLIAVGDIMPYLLTPLTGGKKESLFRTTSIWYFAIVLAVISVPKSLKWLSNLTTVSMASIIVILLTLLFCSMEFSASHYSLFVGNNPFHAIGIISFVFVCHHGTFRVYRALGSPTVQEFSKVTHYSMITTSIISLLTAASGYAAFGSHTRSNILNNISTSSGGWALAIARIFVVINITTTYPLECSVAREVFEYYFPEVTNRRVYLGLLSLVLTSLAAIVATMTRDLGFVMTLTGSVSATILAYIVPPTIWLMCHPRDQRIAAYVCIGFGTTVLLLSMIGLY